MNLIIATTPSGGIGYNNKLPWKSLEGDLKRFKDITTNKIVIMGSNTWKSLKQNPLPNRTNIILTTSKEYQSTDTTIFVNSIESLLEHLKNYNSTDIFVIGGASLINQLLHQIKVIYLTTSNDEYDYDTKINLTHIQLNYFSIFTNDHSDHTFQILLNKTIL